MARDLRTALKMTRPFASLAQEAHLSIARTDAVLSHAMEEAIRPYGITLTQYNVLRILRGAGDDGLCRAEVAARMIRQVPDVTRLLDRLEQGGLIVRTRAGDDRRYVTTRITPPGLALLESLDEPVARLHEQMRGRLDDAQLRQLIDLLEELRQEH
jgi:DNA-binding MarR family transcriptional regulator